MGIQMQLQKKFDSIVLFVMIRYLPTFFSLVFGLHATIFCFFTQ